jgi:hypothetical protein
MMEASRQPKDKNYNLIAVLYQSSDDVESLKTFVQDAEAEGDQELMDFSSGASWRTTWRPPSGPRRCSSPGSRTSKSRGRLRTYQGVRTSEEPDPRYPCSP